MKEKATILCLLLFVLMTNVINANDYGANLIVPPANDDCSTATTLTVNADFLCNTKTPGTVAEATASSEVNVCTGSATNADDDVWFKFIATETSHTVSLLDISGSQTDLYHSVFDGGLTGDCGSLTAGDIVFCSDPNSSNLTGLTIGNTYLIRVFTKGTGSQDTTFNICIGTVPMAPTNDDCANAQAIGAFPFSNSVDASSATNNSGFINVSGCGTAMNDGVWYSFVGNGGDLTFTVTPTAWDAKIGIYSGSCGAFTCAAFSNDGLIGIAESVTFTSTIGTTYYINIGHPDGTTDQSEGIFSLNITSAVLSIEELIAKGFSFYPNPVTDRLQLNAKEEIRHLAVYNAFGQQLRLYSPSRLKTTMDLSDFSTGVYYVRTYIGDGIGMFKIIKK
jgi:hypothetical protein